MTLKQICVWEFLLADKARYWVGVLYPENMIQDWKIEIEDKIQLPFVYCEHNLDTDSNSEHRKDHLHLMIAFPNTTTYKHALEVMNILSLDGRVACNTCQPVFSVRNMFEYLIHNTESCKKKGKYLYPASARILGNGFDIGLYEQVSEADKRDLRGKLRDLIINKCFVNIIDFEIAAQSRFLETFLDDVLAGYSAYFERLCKGNYLKYAKKNNPE